jgi:hypothetical protein
MASPFAKYQSEQVQQMAPGFVEAYGRAGASIGQGIANIGSSVAKGIEIYGQQRKEEIATKAKLAPYIRNDDRIIATEGMIKSGLLTKADDGTVVVSAQWDQYADKKGLAKYIDFYNQTGGDGSKLSGDALIEFAGRFEGEQKFIAEKAANAKTKTENELKQAQIAKLRAEAAAKASEVGLAADIMKGFAGGEAPDSPTAGINLVSNNEITAPPATSAPVGVTKAQPTVPGVAAPAAAAPAAEPEPAVSEALTEGTKAAQAAKAPTSADFDKYGYPKKAAAAPASAPAPTSADFDKYGYPKQKAAAPAEQPAEQAPTAEAQLDQQITPAGTPIPETYDVAAESVAVKERLDKVTADREAVRTKYATERTRNAATIARQNDAVKALTLINPTKGTALKSFLDNSVKFQNEAEARELKALDEKEAAITRDFANYQAADKAQKAAKTEARLERTEVAQVKKDETKAAADIREAKKQRLSDYPRYQVWNHLGSNMPIDKKTGLALDPVDFDIKSLDPSAKIAVSEANEGYNKAVEFMVNLDKTLAERVKGDQGWAGRFRLTADNMKNYYSGELASVFGVATFRRGIVSGGNFSDADREFVKQAITYINSAALDLKPEDLKASLDALAVFVNNMYVRTLESNDMTFDSKGAIAQAEKLEAAGMEDKAATIRETVERSNTFYSRFGMKPPGGNRKSYDKAATLAAFDLLYPKMKAKGFLKEADESK